MRFLVLLALTACATPDGPWRVSGLGVSDDTKAQALALVEAAKRVLPDDNGWLAQGGTIWLEPVISGACYVPPPMLPTGCASPRSIWVLYPHPTGGLDVTRGALPHELAHLGLASGGGFAGPLDLVSEERADAGALLVTQEYRRAASGRP